MRSGRDEERREKEKAYQWQKSEETTVRVAGSLRSVRVGFEGQEKYEDG